MSAELIGILGVGAALGALILTLGTWLRSDVQILGKRVQELGDRVARIEGILESSGLFRPVEASGD